MFGLNSTSPPTLTEKNAVSQDGRVFIVTGGYAGIGFELSKILYHLNGKVYIAGRSKTKALAAIKAIEESQANPEQNVVSSKGSLHFLGLNLDDLSTIKASAQEFLANESRLDVIWHNAGVMAPPEGSVTKQGFDLQVKAKRIRRYSQNNNVFQARYKCPWPLALPALPDAIMSENCGSFRRS